MHISFVCQHILFCLEFLLNLFYRNHICLVDAGKVFLPRRFCFDIKTCGGCNTIGIFINPARFERTVVILYMTASADRKNPQCIFI